MPNTFQRLRPIFTLAVLALAAAGLAWSQGPRKVSQAEAMKAVISRVQPDYPPPARQLRIEGAVELQVFITENGTVDKVEIVSGNPMLTRPAADAIRKWKFSPFMADGKAVRAVAPLTVKFKL